VAGDVRLTPIDEQTLEPLLSVAIAETEPHEVMPPVKAAGWSQVCREAFREFYRSSYGGLDGPTRTLMYAIICDGDVVGMIRMARRDEPDTMETGMWGRAVSPRSGDRRGRPAVTARRGGACWKPPRRGRDHLPQHRGTRGAAPLWRRATRRRCGGSRRDPNP